MSFAIERDEQQNGDSFALQSRADLSTIQLIESRLSCYVRVDDAQKLSPVININFKTGSFRCAEGHLYVSTKFELKVSQKESKRIPGKGINVLAVQCELEAAYVLIKGYLPTPEQIEAFRSGNAIFNAWPHFREYAASSVMRMGFPPPPIPFLRLVPKIDKSSPKKGKGVQVEESLLKRKKTLPKAN